MLDLESIYGKERFENVPSEFSPRLNAEPKEVMIRHVNYSFAELYDWYRSIRSTIFKYKGIQSADIDEYTNRINVTQGFRRDIFKKSLTTKLYENGVHSIQSIPLQTMR